MVYVPGAEAFGFSLRLNEPVMRELLNSPAVRALLGTEATDVHAQVVAHVQAVASPTSAANYVSALWVTEAQSDEMGFNFSGPHQLGDRPIAMVELRSTGSDPAAKPPMVVEVETHSLSSPAGFSVGGAFGEDIR